MADLPRVAVDTCIVIDLLTDEDVTHRENAKWVFDMDGNRHRVVLPALVIAEIPGTGAVGVDDGGKDARSARIDAAHAWIQNAPYVIAELTERTARHAAQLASDYKLKGSDAVVLATALDRQCKVLYTRDHALLNLRNKFDGLLVAMPNPLATDVPSLFDQDEDDED